MFQFFWDLARCSWFGPGDGLTLIELRHYALRILQALSFVLFLVYGVLTVMVIVERICFLLYVLLQLLYYLLQLLWYILRFSP